MSEQVLTAVDGGILTATLNRPEARNALTFEMYDRLADICRTEAARDDVRALIVTGAGEKAFAAGTDISQFRDFSTEADAIGYEERIEVVLNAVEECPVPTIAAISGATPVLDDPAPPEPEPPIMAFISWASTMPLRLESMPNSN